MNKSVKKILFVSHDASRTGAPIVLLNLAEVLRTYNYEIDFLLKNGGPLEADFKIKGKTFIVSKNSNKTLFKRAWNKFFPIEKYSFGNIEWSKYEYIISNTITNGDILPEIKKLFDGPIISYIHELEMGTSYYSNPYDVKVQIELSNGFLTPSEVVKRHLINNLCIKEQKIVSIPSYIPKPKNIKVKDRLTGNVFTVGAVGTLDWRKSPELFILIAYAVYKKRPGLDILFKWKGSVEGHELDRLTNDIRKLKLEDKVSFVESSHDVQSFYSELDLFILTSREDPYPLVILEAANMDIPSLCFENAGGAPEFVKAGNGGKVIPYLDIEDAADQVIYYFENPQERFKAGENAKQWLSNTHQNAEHIKIRFEDAILKVINEPQAI